MNKYLRSALTVEAVKYEPGQNLEDGFERLSDIEANPWFNHDKLYKTTNEKGETVCPYIENKRGRLFIREGDYIIYEGTGLKHVCSAAKFHLRFDKLEEF